MRTPISTPNLSTNQNRNNILGISGDLKDNESQLIYIKKEGFFRNIGYTQVAKNFSSTPLLDCLIYDGDKNDNVLGNNKYFLSYPYDIRQFDVGDYISFNYGGNNSNWLITSLDKSLIHNINGRIKKCNYYLQWKNSEGNLISRWCIISNEVNQSVAVDEGRYMRLGEGKYEISLPADEETIKLSRDKRFIWEGLALRITSTDKTTRPGLQILMTQEHQTNSSIDLINSDGTGIANYYGGSTLSIDVITSDISLLVGDSTTISWIVKLDGVVVDKQVQITSNDDFIQISNITNNSATITAINEGVTSVRVSLDGNSNIYSDIDVQITSSVENNYSEVIEGSNSITIGDTNIYSIFKYNNGDKLSDEYTFLISGNGCVLNVVDGNHCSIYSSVDSGTVVLTAVNNISGNVISKTITLASIW